MEELDAFGNFPYNMSRNKKQDTTPWPILSQIWHTGLSNLDFLKFLFPFEEELVVLLELLVVFFCLSN